MPRYHYRKLRVMCYDARDFGLDQMRDAVAYLSTVEQTPHVGLVAVGTVTKAGAFKLIPEPMLRLDEITRPDAFGGLGPVRPSHKRMDRRAAPARCRDLALGGCRFRLWQI